MAEDADAPGVDVGALEQVVDGSPAVAGQLFDRGGLIVAAGAPDTAVVIAQHGHTRRGQGICDECEGLDGRDRAQQFIAVLGPAAAHQHHGGVRARS